MLRGQAFDTLMLVVGAIVAVAVLGAALSILGNVDRGTDAKDVIPKLASTAFQRGFVSDPEDRVAFAEGDIITGPDAAYGLPIKGAQIVFRCASAADPLCGDSGRPIEAGNGTRVIVHRNAAAAVGVCINQPTDGADQYLVIIGETAQAVQGFEQLNCKSRNPSAAPAANSTPTPSAAPTPAPSTSVIRKKYMIINIDPPMPHFGGERVDAHFNWHDPYALADGFVADVDASSHGIVKYTEAVRIDSDEFMAKQAGFRFDDSSYAGCVADHTQPHCSEIIDYNALLDEYQVCDYLNNGTIDELWVFGGPWMGMYETVQAGSGAIWTNGPAVTGTACDRPLNIFGFSPERGVAEMLEDMGHRVEGTMKYVYGGWNDGYGNLDPITSEAGMTTWDRFTLIDKKYPGHAGCGFVHYAPNSQSDYDWSDRAAVQSDCDDWLNYPALTGQSGSVTCSDWGCDSADPAREHKKWWLSHIPHADGTAPDGKLANWWEYIAANAR